MTDPPPTQMTETDYESILSAVLETARGRWFLAEHMRRNRQADTQLVLKAIGELERSLRERPEPAERVRLDLADMADAIARTKAEIASIKPAGQAGKIGFATDELDAIVATTEAATSEILGAVERIQEIAWVLREQGIDPAICDRLDAQATEAYTACSFQDLTGQRIRRIVGVLHFLEGRIEAMIRIWQISETHAPAHKAAGDPLLYGPARRGEGLLQSEIDDLITIDHSDDIGWAETPPAAAAEIAREVEGDIAMGATAIVSGKSPPAAVSIAAEPAPTRIPPPVLAKTGPAPLASPATLPAAAKLSARLREAIEGLSPAERMALFS